MNPLSMRLIKQWHVVGLISILVLGTLLHYTYQWSGFSLVVGIFSAVNESVWEHLKLGFWPLIFYSLVEYGYLKPIARNYFLAKALGILTLMVFITVFFYSYTAVIGKNILAVDIGSFVVGAILCQYVSYRIMIGKERSPAANLAGAGILLLLAVAFAVFTFMPLELFLFREPKESR